MGRLYIYKYDIVSRLLTVTWKKGGVEVLH
jgi:hypothetical protein